MDSRMQETSTEQKRKWLHVLGELLAHPFTAVDRATPTAPHLRRRTSVSRVLFYFVLASLPALLAGLSSLGSQTLAFMRLNQVPDLPGMPWGFFTVFGFDASSDGIFAAFLLGSAYFLPLLIVTLATGIFWEALFATVRRRPVDPGWLMACWLYALMLPANLPLSMAVLGISFGLVLGKHIFGGTGRYIASPALLGVLFLQFSYPGHFAGAASFIPVPGLAAGTTWTAVITDGLSETTRAGLNWIDVFLGIEIGPAGTLSTLLCLAGATLLIFKGAASVRTIAGGFTGLIIASALVNTLGADQAAWQLPWYWHIAVGNFAFGIAFIATDPTPAPVTAEGRWIQGMLVGVLTVLIRAFNPAHPDGTLYAILLAALATPVIDHFVIRARMARWQRRWSSRE